MNNLYLLEKQTLVKNFYDEIKLLMYEKKNLDFLINEILNCK